LPLLGEEIPGNRIEEMVKRICLQIVGGILCVITSIESNSIEVVLGIRYWVLV
jgi:hypothetical protein